MQIRDKKFQLYISEQEIKTAILKVAQQINADYKGQKVIFIGILNGAFMFAAELMKNIDLVCEISFVKVNSYEGTSSTGEVHELIGLKTNVESQHVVIVEDIVDTGLTIDKLYKMLEENSPKSIKTATMLFKPDAFKGKNEPKYIGLSIENKFIVGFGLDYMEEGRNTKDIYQIKE